MIFLRPVNNAKIRQFCNTNDRDCIYIYIVLIFMHGINLVILVFLCVRICIVITTPISEVKYTVLEINFVFFYPKHYFVISMLLNIIFHFFKNFFLNFFFKYKYFCTQKIIKYLAYNFFLFQKLKNKI